MVIKAKSYIPFEQRIFRKPNVLKNEMNQPNCSGVGSVDQRTAGRNYYRYSKPNFFLTNRKLENKPFKGYSMKSREK